MSVLFAVVLAYCVLIMGWEGILGILFVCHGVPGLALEGWDGAEGLFDQSGRIV